MAMTTCDWCMERAPVHTIPDNLWRFWTVISPENPILESYKNICEKCESRYGDFSTYVERCKTNACLIEGILSVRADRLIDIEFVSVKEEILDEQWFESDHPTASDGVVVENRALSTGPSNVSDEAKNENEDTTKAVEVKGEPFFDLACLYCYGIFRYNSRTTQKSCECPFCGRTNSMGPPDRVRRVETVGRGEKRFKCLFCDKGFNNSGHLKNHIRVHTGEKPFKCSLCDKAFRESQHLKNHMRRHTGKKPFKCSICNKGFVDSSGLKAHIRGHTGEKPFKCPVCDKAFKEASELKSHMRVHTDEKPFKCSICNKGYKRSLGLKCHMYSHTGEKPYKCSVCDEAFRQRSNLKRHMHRHTGEKPFKCSICNKGFVESSSLRNHMRLHTGEKPYL